MSDQLYDVIVIGAGPAGCAAATYTSRAKLSTLIIGGVQPGGQLMWTTEVENYPGFKEGVLGPELMASMLAQAQRFGAEMLQTNATSIVTSGAVKQVSVGEAVYRARTLIITTGARARMLGVGEDRLLGRGVGTCAVCDAAFYKGRKVFIVGGGDAAMEDALAVSKFAAETAIIHRGSEFRASQIMKDRVLTERQIPVLWNSQVTSVQGEQKLESITIRNTQDQSEQQLPADGLFLAIGHIPDTDFIGDQIVRDAHGYAVTGLTTSQPQSNQDMWLSNYPTQTSVEGVFAAGDVVDFRYRQAITAAGMGCQAALDVEKYLVHHR